jgi:hypothetical protein
MKFDQALTTIHKNCSFELFEIAIYLVVAKFFVHYFFVLLHNLEYSIFDKVSEVATQSFTFSGIS